MSAKSILARIENKLEAIGLILLLFAFGWECLTQRLESNKNEALLLILNEKVDVLWDCQYEAFTHNNKTISAGIVYLDKQVTNKHWQSYEQIRENFNSSDEQVERWSKLRYVFYIIGSLLVIFAKWNKD